MTDHTTDYDDTVNSFRDGIRPGDIVHDLAQMGWPKMRVIRQEAPSVADYIDTRGQDLRQYEKNALSGADLDDEVFLVTFLTDSPMKKAQTHYPVPASRIAKQDLTSEADHVGDDYDPVFHPADQAVYDVLVEAFHAALVADRGNPDAQPDSFVQALRFCIPDRLNGIQEAAHELAEVDVEAAPATTTDGGDVDPDDQQDDQSGADDDGLGDFEDYDGDA